VFTGAIGAHAHAKDRSGTARTPLAWAASGSPMHLERGREARTSDPQLVDSADGPNPELLTRSEPDG
jgi:hypothetical protein